GSASYVTGSHSLKGGVQFYTSKSDLDYQNINASLQQRYVNGVANAVSIFPLFTRTVTEGGNHAAYVQDRWTIHRLTVNAGLRLEYVTGDRPGLTAKAGRFTVDRSVAGAHLYDYVSPAPRFSGAYDLFGNGKTAIKASVGKFYQSSPSPGGY